MLSLWVIFCISDSCLFSNSYKVSRPVGPLRGRHPVPTFSPGRDCPSPEEEEGAEIGPVVILVMSFEQMMERGD